MVTRSLCLLLLLALSAAAQTPRIPQPESVNRNGLAGMWLVPGYQTGNGLTPTQARDASGRGNHGATVGSPNYGVIYSRAAIMFNGSSQYLNNTNAPSLDVADKQLTAMAWILVTTNQPSTVGMICAKQRGSTYTYSLNVRADQPNKPGFSLYNGTLNPEVWASQAISFGRWYHIAGVYNGTTMNIYVDGLVAASPVNTTIDISSAFHTFRVGRNAGSGTSFYFNGSIHDVRIYKRALTAAEIRAIYRGIQ
jgi:hypothetical protein